MLACPCGRWPQVSGQPSHGQHGADPGVACAAQADAATALEAGRVQASHRRHPARGPGRPCAPGYGYYTGVKDRYDANRASLSQARWIARHATHILTALDDDAFTILAQPAAPTTIAR